MNPEYSPFTPGQPVPIEFFVGRVGEIERLRSIVRASCSGKFRVGFVAGERGIGKSSLVSFVRHLVEREQSVAGAHVFLGGVDTLSEMVRRTFDRLLKDSIEKPWHRKVRDLFGPHVKQIGLFGITVELELAASDLDSLVTGFAPSLRRLLAQMKEERKALLLILDDINGLASSREFANWLKSTVDEVATAANGLSACLLVVGLEERRRQTISRINSTVSTSISKPNAPRSRSLRRVSQRSFSEPLYRILIPRFFLFEVSYSDSGGEAARVICRR